MDTPFVQDVNYLRLKSLIHRAVPDVVRIVFDKYFHCQYFGQLPRILDKYKLELEAMKKQHIISPHQWELLFPSVGTTTSRLFDISLMSSLLEHLVFNNGSDGNEFSMVANRVLQPTTAVGLSRFMIIGVRFEGGLPPRNDVSVRADLRRIMWIRYLLQNNGSEKMSNKDVQQYLDDISGALERLGGPKYKEISAQIKDNEIGIEGDGLQNTRGFCRKIPNFLKNSVLCGSYSSYENRVYLIGPRKSGKTSLACILLGTDIPKTWNSINELSIYCGQNGIHRRKKEMNPLSAKIDVGMEKEITLCDIIDFGGQDDFDMIHQLFISQRGTFCFMFDGRNKLSDILEGQKRTTAELLIHWIDLILTYGNSQNGDFPKILLAATHRDQIPEHAIEERRAELVAQIDNVLGLHPFRHHIVYDNLAFLNTQSKNDSEIKSLKKILVDIAFSQPTWGEQFPEKWRYLQQPLLELKEKGRKILERIEVVKINEGNAEATLDSNELITFLKTQHALGKIMYFDSDFLRELVILDPFYMVTVLRSFVTDARFWPEEEEYSNIHQTLHDTGILKKADLFRLWEQHDFELLRYHREQIAEILVRLDVLVQPQEYSKEFQKETECDYFFVPCMVQKTDSTNYMPDNCTSDRSISLTYKFSSSNVFPAFAFRLFGACLSMWECKEYKGRKMLFLDSVVLSFDKDNDVSITVCGSRINIYLIHSKTKEFIEWNVATSIQECVTDTLERILLFYKDTFGGSIRFQPNMQLSLFNFEFKLMCGMKECLAPECVRQFTPESRWTCENNKTHDVRWLLLWFPCRISSNVDSQYQEPGPDEQLSRHLDLIPTDRQLRRFAIQFTKDDFRNLMIYLGMDYSIIEQIFDEHRRLHDAMFYCLWNWREKSETKPSFSALKTALEKSDLTSHYLLKAFEVNTVVEGVPTNLQDLEPRDTFLIQLSREIGKEVFQLAIELELKVPDYEEIEYSCNYKNLPEQAYAVLRKWKQSRDSPTIQQLANAMSSINRDVNSIVKLLKEW